MAPPVLCSPQSPILRTRPPRNASTALAASIPHRISVAVVVFLVKTDVAVIVIAVRAVIFIAVLSSSFVVFLAAEIEAQLRQGTITIRLPATQGGGQEGGPGAVRHGALVQKVGLVMTQEDAAVIVTNDLDNLPLMLFPS
jgi:hypothetical protein